MNNSVLDFRAVAFCTISKILAMELSLNSLVVSISITPSKLMLPAKTFSPFAIVSGLLSPVNAAMLNEPFSESRIPSKGIFFLPHELALFRQFQPFLDSQTHNHCCDIPELHLVLHQVRLLYFLLLC